MPGSLLLREFVEFEQYRDGESKIRRIDMKPYYKKIGFDYMQYYMGHEKEYLTQADVD